MAVDGTERSNTPKTLAWRSAAHRPSHPRPKADTLEPGAARGAGGTFNISEIITGSGLETFKQQQQEAEAIFSLHTQEAAWQGTMSLRVTINFHLQPTSFPFRMKVIQRFGFLRN